MADEISESQIKAVEAEIRKADEAKSSKLERELREKIATEQKLKELEAEKVRLAQEIQDGKKREEEFRKTQEEEINKLRKEMNEKTTNYQSSKAIVQNNSPYASGDAIGTLKTQLKNSEEMQKQVEVESARQWAKANGFNYTF